MLTILGIAFGIVLILEGIGPLITPCRWRAMMLAIAKQEDNQLRRIGGCLVVAGVITVYYFTV